MTSLIENFLIQFYFAQLNEPLWQIHGSADGQSRCGKELHISYHNGDHYNSVRRLGDLESNEPANLKIDVSYFNIKLINFFEQDINA